MERNKLLKPIFDYVMAILLLIILLIPLAIAWVFATIETGQNGIFIQKRIGRKGLPFNIYKIRTMRGVYKDSITTETTHDITKCGKFFIKYKIDEIPQLLNILDGTMSFVGPRPDVPGYADKLKGEDRIILKVKPGITGPAQLKYKNEAELLAKSDNPKKLNDEILWPDKVAINKEYVLNRTFMKDLKIIWKTIF